MQFPTSPSADGMPEFWSQLFAWGQPNAIVGYAAVALLAVGVGTAVTHAFQQRRRARLLEHADARLRDLLKLLRPAPGRGLTLDARERLEAGAKNLPPLAAVPLLAILRRTVRVRFDSDDEHWDPGAPFDAQDVPDANAGRWVPVAPGVLTSLGLTVTFIALVIGLSALKPQPDQTITGVNTLVHSLGGKFIASIGGLVASILVLMTDVAYAKPRYAKATAQLRQAIQSAVPTLTTQHVVAAILVEQRKQTVSLSNISTDVVEKFATVFRDDLADRFSQGFSGALAERMGPLLDDVKSSMAELRGTVANLESQKSESVVGQLRELTTALEASLSKALGQMVQEFRAALSGSAQHEFEGLAAVVRDSASNLQATNQVFGKLEASLGLLVEQTRTVAGDHVESTRLQSERLNALVEGLVTRLNEQATESSHQVTQHLGAAVLQMSERMRELTNGFGSDIARLTTETQAAARAGLDDAQQATAGTAERLRAVLESMDQRLQGLNEASASLQNARSAVEGTLQRNAEGLASMQRASTAVQAYTADLLVLQKHVTEAQAIQNQLAGRAQEHTVAFDSIAKRQVELAGKYETLLSQYETAFSTIDERLAPVMQTINDGLGRYLDAIQGNFKTIVQRTNELLPASIDRIREATDALKEDLDSLAETIEEATRRLNTRETA